MIWFGLFVIYEPNLSYIQYIVCKAVKIDGYLRYKSSGRVVHNT